jgi:probable rRNA maturation factor
MTVEIHNLQTHIPIDLKLVERAALTCAEEEALDLSISLVDDQAIREVNARHLDRDRPTDVIAFDYQAEAGGISGEVIVSAECARAEAEARGHDPVEELLLYVVHGIMHLRGFDDKNGDDAKRMWKAQNRVMKRLGFSGEIGP